MVGFKNGFMNTKKEPIWGCFIREEAQPLSYPFTVPREVPSVEST